MDQSCEALQRNSHSMDSTEGWCCLGNFIPLWQCRCVCCVSFMQRPWNGIRRRQAPFWILYIYIYEKPEWIFGIHFSLFSFFMKHVPRAQNDTQLTFVLVCPPLGLPRSVPAAVHMGLGWWNDAKKVSRILACSSLYHILPGPDLLRCPPSPITAPFPSLLHSTPSCLHPSHPLHWFIGAINFRLKTNLTAHRSSHLLLVQQEALPCCVNCSSPSPL